MENPRNSVKNNQRPQNGAGAKKSGLTEKEQMGAESKVRRYKLNKPMKWSEFRSMPTDIQSEYLLNLRATFNINSSDLVRMFHTGGTNLRTYIRDLAIPFPISKTGRRKTANEIARWDEFLKGDAEPPAAKPAPPPAVSVEPELDMYICNDDTYIENFIISFGGFLDPKRIANSLLSMLGKGVTGSVEILYTREAAHKSNDGVKGGDDQWKDSST